MNRCHWIDGFFIRCWTVFKRGIKLVRLEMRLLAGAGRAQGKSQIYFDFAASGQNRSSMILHSTQMLFLEAYLRHDCPRSARSKVNEMPWGRASHKLQ